MYSGNLVGMNRTQILFLPIHMKIIQELMNLPRPQKCAPEPSTLLSNITIF
jgi:hypothetical protein